MSFARRLRALTLVMVVFCVSSVIVDTIREHLSADDHGGLISRHPRSVYADPSTPAAGGFPLIDVLEPEALAELEAQGLDFGTVLTGAPGNNAQLTESSARYRSLIEPLQREIEAIKEARPGRAGVGMRFHVRLFDPEWLTAPTHYFELVAVINRLDRQPFDMTHCGETRLIYRLAYRTDVKGTEVASRLPMMLAIVMHQEGDLEANCRDVAQRWQAPQGADPITLARWLVAKDHPLAGTRVNMERLKGLAVDMQTQRLPGTIHPKLGGHSEYLMRMFALDPGAEALREAPLENQLDVTRIAGDEALFEELLAWLREPAQLAAMDHGTVSVPPKFLATRAASVSPKGLARYANRPFYRLFGEQHFEDLALESYDHIRSPQALIRRLDTMSCTGCHQTRDIAGFHLLGREDDPTRRLDALEYGESAHYSAERSVRLARLEARLEGRLEDADAPRLSPERPLTGAHNEHCGLGDPGFARWTCAEGFECVGQDDEEHVGLCLPEAGPGAGDPCEHGQLRTRGDRPERDHLYEIKELPCQRGGRCRHHSQGWPGGMCMFGCTALRDGEACGRTPGLNFNRCVFLGNPFEYCLREHNNKSGLRSCDADRPCREDYVCARNVAADTGGVCIPTYFVFQLRVDGHP